MREIKFRAWAGNQMWADIAVFNNDAYVWNYEETSLVPLFSDAQVRLYSKPTLMQYTGLKDRSGKEIYEGDIIVWHINEIRPMAPVIFECGAFWMGEDISLEHNIGSVCNDWLRGEYEIKGNIYETPELLNNYYDKEEMG